MRNFRKIFLSGFLIFSLFSCDDALDIIQDGEINNEATFKTVADLRSFLVGDIYNQVNAINEIRFTSVFTDEVGIGPSSGGQNLELHRYFLNPISGEPSGIWLEKYALINRVNRLIEASNLVVPSTPLEVSQKNNILAEARTLRAFAYLQLEAYFSTDMSDDNALGVLLLDFVPTPATKLPRVSNAQIYALIEADLLFAQNNLSTSATVNPNTGIHTYVTPSLVDAIRARFYTYRKKYDLAEQAALRVLTSFGSGLSTSAAYGQMWRDVVGAEVIFGASRPSSGTWGNIAASFYFNTTTITGGAFHDMGFNLYNLLIANPSDVRISNFVDLTSDVAKKDIMIDKYPGKTNQPLRNNLKLFRLSEMYLILAEAQVGKAAPNLAAAATYVQNIRTARGTGQTLPTYLTSTAAYADILLERRKELCFEGHRYLDIKRLGAVSGGLSIDRNIADDNIPSTPLTLSLTDHRFTLPIPQSEKAANDITQNPNY
jgi:hypothetical protein